MYRRYFKSGFTIVELLIVVVIIVILATLTSVAYNGVQWKAGVSAVQSALNDVNKEVIAQELRTDQVPEEIPSGVATNDDVELSYQSINTVHYSNLSTIQNGVLFQSICEELIQYSGYSTIHGRSGGQTDSVVMKCDDSINKDSLLITGWDSKTWSVPVSKSQLESYMASVPYDSWWVDRQEVIRAFYGALISRFESRGGKWPITSFWDPWANQGNNGVQKENLRVPDPPMAGLRYCIGAKHTAYDDIELIVTSDDSTIRPGTCDYNR